MRGVARWLGAIGIAVAVQALAWLAAGVWAAAPLTGAAVTFGMVAGAVIGVAAATPVGLGARALGWLVLPALLVAAAATAAPAPGAGPGALAVAAAVAAGLLGAGTLVGGVIGGRIEHPSHLWVVAYVSSIADAFSVLSPAGPSAQVVKDERLLALLAISWPAPGTGDPVPVLGVGDVVLCALYLVAAKRLGLPVGRTVAALGGGFAAVLVALLVFGVPLPALPFLGLAVVVAHPITWRLRREERRKALIGMAVITAVFAALFLWR